MPKETNKYDKTTSCIAPDNVKLFRVMSWVFKDVNKLLENKFQGNENMKDCNSKICKKFLKIHCSVPEN